MKITIEISDADAKILARWASVSRTLSVAAQACVDAGFKETASAHDIDKFDCCEEELETITPVLDRLHQAARTELWKHEQETAKEKSTAAQAGQDTQAGNTHGGSGSN